MNCVPTYGAGGGHVESLVGVRFDVQLVLPERIPSRQHNVGSAHVFETICQLTTICVSRVVTPPAAAGSFSVNRIGTVTLPLVLSLPGR
jgi:hypothetical protein